MKKTFEITYPDNLGPEWLNVENLESLMFSFQQIGVAKDLIVTEDVTQKLNQSEAIHSFLGWLTVLDEKQLGWAIKYGHYTMQNLVNIFCRTNSLDPPRAHEYWPSNAKTPDLDKFEVEREKIKEVLTMAAVAIAGSGATIKNLVNAMNRYTELGGFLGEE